MGTALRRAVVVAGLACGALALTSTFSIYRVASASMEPTLHCAASPECKRLEDDRVVVSRLIYRFRPVRRGDIVAFTSPATAPTACRGGGVRLKRIVGLPGEFVNPSHAIRGARRRWPVRVPADHYFVVGDNLHGSCDSREVGPIPRENLIGKVILVYSPRWHLRLP